MVGTGPFVLDPYTAGQQVVYKRNPAYDWAPAAAAHTGQAFRRAVAVQAVLESVYRGTATRAWSVVSPSSRFYDKTLEGPYGGDTTKANAPLAAAGWTTRDAARYRTGDGRRLTVRLVQSAPFVRDRREILAQAVQAAVKQSAGIHLDVQLVGCPDLRGSCGGRQCRCHRDVRPSHPPGPPLSPELLIAQ